MDIRGKVLVRTCRDAMNMGIDVCGPDVPFKEIGNVIHSYARKHGFTVNRDFAGHGIGSAFHEAPHILHYENEEGGIMKPGMVFTIEPMLCEGSGEAALWNDGWTATTVDGKRSAQFEHTVLITEDGVEILTANDLPVK